MNMDILAILGQAQTIAGALVIICGGVITIAMIIPGEQPEKFLKSWKPSVL
jgi:hypothetical protein